MERINTFLKQNKNFFAIVLAGTLISGAIYFSNKSDPRSESLLKQDIPVVLQDTTQNSFESSFNKSQLQSESNDFCINYRDAKSYVGEYKCVTGTVDNVFISKKSNNFLNFCPNYKTCPFSAVIFNSDAYKIPNVKSYGGKTVEITGLIKTYQGRAEIIINDPNQIKIK